MALKQTQHLKLLQKLSPQQIQLMKLLQLPTVALEQRIKEELELNPALEEENNELDSEDVENEYDEVEYSDNDDSNDFDEKEKEVAAIVQAVNSFSLTALGFSFEASCLTEGN